MFQEKAREVEKGLEEVEVLYEKGNYEEAMKKASNAYDKLLTLLEEVKKAEEEFLEERVRLITLIVAIVGAIAITAIITVSLRRRGGQGLFG